MKTNKIIKTICFSLLALSVTLCAVFTLPKKDNLIVNAEYIYDDSEPFYPIIPYTYVNAFDVNFDDDYITSLTVPTFTNVYLSPTNLTNTLYDVNVHGLDFMFSYNYSNPNVVDNQVLSLSGGFAMTVEHKDGYRFSGNVLQFVATDFVLPIYNNNESYPFSTLTFIDYVDFVALTSVYTITAHVDFAINGDFIENNYIRLTGNSDLSQIRVYDYIQGYFRRNYLFGDILYVYVRDLTVTANFDSVFYYDRLLLSVGNVYYGDYQNDLNIIAYYDSFETTKVEYELNLFQTLIRTVHEFMCTEFLPNVSFYDLLLYVLVIPLVIMLLKMWLGG